MKDPNVLSHSTTIEINTPWEQAFNFLQNPLNLGRWALGCWDTSRVNDEGLHCGTSLFSGEKTYFALGVNRDARVVDMLLGEPGALQPRISARVVPGLVYSQSDSTCRVTLDAWRETTMSDERWHQLCVCHEAEILLIKALVERGQ